MIYAEKPIDKSWDRPASPRGAAGVSPPRGSHSWRSALGGPRRRQPARGGAERQTGERHAQGRCMVCGPPSMIPRRDQAASLMQMRRADLDPPFSGRCCPPQPDAWHVPPLPAPVARSLAARAPPISCCDLGGLVEAGYNREDDVTRELRKNYSPHVPESYPRQTRRAPEFSNRFRKLCTSCSGSRDLAQIRPNLANNRQCFAQLVQFSPSWWILAEAGQL